MLRTRIRSVLTKSLILLGFLSVCIVPPAFADAISFQLSSSSLSTSSGGTVTFTTQALPVFTATLDRQEDRSYNITNEEVVVVSRDFRTGRAKFE